MRCPHEAAPKMVAPPGEINPVGVTQPPVWLRLQT
jgi:hypothetical protein